MSLPDIGFGSKTNHDQLGGATYPRYMVMYAERKETSDSIPNDEDPAFGFRGATTHTTGTDAKVYMGILNGVLPTPEHNITVSNLSAGIVGETDRITVKPGIILNPTTTTIAPDTKGSLMYDTGTDELKYYDGSWQIISAGGLSSHALDGAYHTATGLTVGWVLSADSATTFSWKAPTGGGTDDDAIHDNVANEITAITPKTTLSSTDEFVLEDGGSSFVKKAVTFANIESSISLANLGTRTHASLSDAPADAHHVEFVLADFTTAFAAESLANLTTRAHSDLSDTPTDAHHSESHVLSGSTHTATSLTVGWVISADSATTFSWKAPTGGMTAHDLTGAYHTEDATGGSGNVIVADSGTTFSWQQLDYTELASIPSTFDPVAHDLTSAYHTDSGLTGGHFLKADTTTTFSFQAHGLGASDVGAYTTAQVDSAIDTDISTHAGLPNAHHAQSHTLAGSDHTATGLTVGWVIAADSSTTFSWQAPSGGGPGSGTQWTLPVWDTTSTLGDSMISQDSGGTLATVDGDLYVANQVGIGITAGSQPLKTYTATAADAIYLDSGGVWSGIASSTALYLKAASYVHLQSTATNQHMFFDCGGTFTFRDQDNGDATVFTIDATTGDVQFDGTLTVDTIAAGVADYNAFLVSDTGAVKFRTGAEAYSDMDGYVTADFTTDFAAESLANLTTRTHASLSDAPTDAHHNEIHALAVTGPHTGTLPLTDLAVGAQGSIIYRDGTDWAELTLGTNTYVLKSGATDVSWSTVDWTELTGTQPAPVAHNLIDTIGHPVSGLTGGHFLKALTTTTYGFAAHGLGAGDVGAYTTAEVDSAIDTDITTHAGDDNAHHEVFELSDFTTAFAAEDFNNLATTAHVLASADHTVSGLTAGDILSADTSTTYSWKVNPAATVPLALTDIASYVQGSIIIGGGTDWEALAAGTEDYVLKMGAAEPAWGQVDWSELTGSQPSPISHDFDVHIGDVDLVDIAGYAQGSIIKGGASDWESLVKGTENYVLKAGATDIAWGTVDWSELSGTQPAPVAHNLIDTTGHPVSGLTGGHFLKATGTTTYAFGAHGLTYSDVGAEQANANIQSHVASPVTDAHHTKFTGAEAVAAVIAENPLTLTNDLTITGGNLGIGIAADAGYLIESVDGNYLSRLGRTQIGHATYTNYAAFCYRGMSGAGQYALIQNSLGLTSLNSASGQPVDFRINHVIEMNLTASGLQMQSAGARVDEFSTDVNLAGNSDTALVTEKAVKTYVDAATGGPGSGTQWTLPVWDTTTTLGDSMVSQNAGGTLATVTGALTVSGALKAGGDGFDIDATGKVVDITVAAATVDTDKFIVQDGSQLKYRSGAQVLSDIGAGGTQKVGPTFPAVLANGATWSVFATQAVLVMPTNDDDCIFRLSFRVPDEWPTGACDLKIMYACSAAGVYSGKWSISASEAGDNRIATEKNVLDESGAYDFPSGTTNTIYIRTIALSDADIVPGCSLGIKFISDALNTPSLWIMEMWIEP